jgi:hypothetical protein
LLLRQLTRMHHHKAECDGGDSRITLLHLHLPDDALPMPASGRFRLGPPRFLHQQRQGGLLLPPRFEVLAHSAGAWDEGYETNTLLQTYSEGTATLGLTLRDNPPYPLQAQR